jgi:hypothetical protein
MLRKTRLEFKLQLVFECLTVEAVFTLKRVL